MANPIGDYFRGVSPALPVENATEFTFRAQLQNLLVEIAKLPAVREKSGNITVLHEPSRKRGIGAPDFLLLNGGGAIVGYVECKKPGENLQALIGGKQLDKYGGLSDNVLLTDYRRFIRLQGGKQIGEFSFAAAAPSAKQKEQLQNLLAEFMSAAIRPIDNPKTLAKILAGRSKALRDELQAKLADDSGNNPTARELAALQQAFRTALFDDISAEQFADALAQTVTYTLLMVKLQNPRGENLTDIFGLQKHIPKNYALIREIGGFLAKLEDTPLKYLLDGVLAALNAVDAAALTERAGAAGGTDEDPYFYFYENFLAAYDAKLRKSRGVYYTPPPAVKFIVRATDDILRRDFGKAEGLADSSVTALDFAAGTGTFMLEIIRLALENKSAAKRDIIARRHLLKNLYGFELVISSYVIAHLKLSAFFAECGVLLGEDERINIFLTNTLENKQRGKRGEKQGDLPSIIPALTEEVERAQKIKEQDILVITGNPPYSVRGQTAGSEFFMRAAKRPSKNEPNKQVRDTRDTWIGGLLRAYYEMDGKPLGEKNPKALQDDYVKFIRFAQHKICEAGRGVVAVITNHAFLDNPTFRGMRSSLLKSFDRLYFLDLHGNSNKRETAPGGGRDENIFDIRQGVAISILVKKPGLEKGVFHADLWGTRAAKEEAFLESAIDSIAWKKIAPSPNAVASYLFIPENKTKKAEYKKFRSLKDIFCASNAGIVTARDSLTVQFSRAEMQSVAKRFANMPPEEAREHFGLGEDTRDWKVRLAQKDLRESGLDAARFRPIAYRPFDIRHTYYTGKSRGFHCMPRDFIMQHMFGDIALVSVRQVAENAFSHVFAADTIINYRLTLSNKGGAYLFPLYRREMEMGKITRCENFTSDFRKWVDARYGKKHSPEDILACIYAVMHSPEYRRRYAEFLRLDFPRVPFPQDNKHFLRYAAIGKKLLGAHLLQGNFGGQIGLRGSGVSHKVEKVYYDEKARRLYFNKNEYLSPLPPEVFYFEIGGYKPLDKFLKSRKGRDIGGDMETLEKAANAIAYTVRLMKDIPLP